MHIRDSISWTDASMSNIICIGQGVVRTMTTSPLHQLCHFCSVLKRVYEAAYSAMYKEQVLYLLGRLGCLIAG
uniref:Uncharacterized protein n=1 Tax=Arundo donax TaxID=35708 RepID=A0A0A8ZEL1_ARUDO